jgi:predicted HicB family RNase H-like nuclease
MTEQKTETTNYRIDLPKAVHKSLKVIAAKEGITLSGLIIRVLAAYVQHVEKQDKSAKP